MIDKKLSNGTFRHAVQWLAMGYSVARLSARRTVLCWNPSDDEVGWLDNDGDFQPHVFGMRDFEATDWYVVHLESEWDGWLEGELDHNPHMIL